MLAVQGRHSQLITAPDGKTDIHVDNRLLFWTVLPPFGAHSFQRFSQLQHANLQQLALMSCAGPG